jgi:hypothetical protein
MVLTMIAVRGNMASNILGEGVKVPKIVRCE